MTAVENAAIRELAEELRGLSTKVSAATEQAAQARIEVAELKVAVEPAVRLSSGLAAFGRAAAGTGRAIKWGAGVGSGAAGFLLVLKTFGVL